MMNSVRVFLIFVVMFFLSNSVLAQNKVVVVPLMSGDAFQSISSFYSRTNQTSPELGSNPGGSDHLRACVMLGETSAFVVWQSIYSLVGPAGDFSDVLLAGVLTNGNGRLKASPNSCTSKVLAGDPYYGAMISNVTSDSLTLTIKGNRDVVLDLDVVSPNEDFSCVAFIPDADLCQ